MRGGLDEVNLQKGSSLGALQHAQLVAAHEKKEYARHVREK